MYIARIKINWGKENENEYYEKDKWMKAFEYNDKICNWRIKENGIIEFVLGNYIDRFEALEDGKMLYFNILYDLHRNEHFLKLGDDSYIKQIYHENRGYTLEEFKKNEEWFFSNKKFRANFYGLEVFEIDNDIADYDKYYENYKIEMKTINNKPFKFLNRISNLDSNYKYSKKCQEIFNLVRMVEESEIETKIILLCQALEMMGEDVEKDKDEIKLIDDLINLTKNSEIEDTKKDSLISYLENGKRISSRKKCEILIDKYCKYEYNQFDKKKIFKEAYSMRSKIIHGDKIEEDKAFNVSYYLKYIVLDVFKEWSKDNKE